MKFLLLIASGLFISTISSLTVDVQQEVDAAFEEAWNYRIVEIIFLFLRIIEFWYLIFCRKTPQEEERGSSGAKSTKEIVMLDVQVRFQTSVICV